VLQMVMRAERTRMPDTRLASNDADTRSRHHHRTGPARPG
jgi:hypothetical protein